VRRSAICKDFLKMKSSLLAIAAAAAIGFSANVALAQETGFGGQPDASKNQVPGPSVDKPSDPQAGNPGSAAQIPTAPEAQEDLYDNGASGAATGEGGAEVTKPATSNPAP
jgi:hypothetical protein